MEGVIWRAWGRDVVPVFLRDGEGERHADGGAGGNLGLLIRGIENCFEGCWQELGAVRF